MILVDFHSDPGSAPVGGPQALLPSMLTHFLEDVGIASDAYERRLSLARRSALEVEHDRE